MVRTPENLNNAQDLKNPLTVKNPNKIKPQVTLT